MKRLLAVLPAMALLAFGGALAEETAEHAEPPAKLHNEAPLRKRAEHPGIMDELSLLFRLQDGTAAGQADSIAGQKQILSHLRAGLEAFFKSASPDQLRLIAPDVVAYVLSGGDPDIAESLAKNQSLDPRLRRILEGSVVFMRGDREAAAQQFRDLDTEHLPIRLVGRLALVQALLDNENMVAKQRHLAIAMAAMPGSLIEESALRRSTLAYAEARDEHRFWERFTRYQRRFPKSLYGSAFWHDVSGALIEWSAKEPGFDFGKLDIEWSGIDIPRRRDLYLELTRQAAAANARRITEFAAVRLQRLSMEGSEEDQVARLYMVIYKIASPESDEALRELKSIRHDLLGEQDRQLLNAALAISEEINRPLPAVSLSMGGGKSEDDALQNRGRSALTESEKLLGSLSP